MMKRIHSAFDMRDGAIFLQAAKDASFTAAGARLGMTPSAVSKAISRLEGDLGVRLLRRSPRFVSLTPEGALFASEAEALAAAMTRTRDLVHDLRGRPRGRLRVSVPANFGRMEVAPRLPLFAERYPDLDIECLLMNGPVDPIEHELDVAVWVNWEESTDPRLAVRKLPPIGTVMCAAPSYLARHPAPQTIADLDHHRTLGGIDERSGEVMPWRFRQGDQVIDHTPRCNILSNAIDLLSSLAIAGGGIVYLPDYMAIEPIRRGELRVVLADCKLETRPFQIVTPKHRISDPGVIAFLELLSDIISHRRVHRGGRRRGA